MAKKATKKPVKKSPAQAKTTQAKSEERDGNMLQDSVSAGFGLYANMIESVKERIEDLRDASAKGLVAKVQDRVEEAREDNSKEWSKIVSRGEKARAEARKSVDEMVEKASFDVNFSFSLKEKLDQAEEVSNKLRDMLNPSKVA